MYIIGIKYTYYIPARFSSCVTKSFISFPNRFSISFFCHGDECLCVFWFWMKPIFAISSISSFVIFPSFALIRIFTKISFLSELLYFSVKSCAIVFSSFWHILQFWLDLQFAFVPSLFFRSFGIQRGLPLFLHQF